MKKVITIIMVVLLVLLIGGAVVGVVSKGFKNWDYKNWFKPTATVTETSDEISSGVKYVWISFDIDESKEVVVVGSQRRYVVDQSVLFPSNERARTEFFELVKIYCKQERKGRAPIDPEVGYTDMHFFLFEDLMTIGEIDFLGTQRIADGVNVSWYHEDAREAMQFDFYTKSSTDPIFDLGGPPPVRLLFFTDGTIECIRWFEKPENSFPYELNIELYCMFDYIAANDVYFAANR